MPHRQIFRTATRVTSDFIGTIQGRALQNVKLRTGMSDQSMAERLGKSDRKSATMYLAGETCMDLTSLFSALSDPEMGDEFINDLLAPFDRTICPTRVEQAPVDAVAADLAGFLAVMLKALADGKLTHVEKVRMAKLVKPLLPKLQAIVLAGDEIAA